MRKVDCVISATWLGLKLSHSTGALRTLVCLATNDYMQLKLSQSWKIARSSSKCHHNTQRTRFLRDDSVALAFVMFLAATTVFNELSSAK